MKFNSQKFIVLQLKSYIHTQFNLHIITLMQTIAKEIAQKLFLTPYLLTFWFY